MDKREPSFKAKAIRIQILILVVFFVLYIVSSVVYYRSYTEKIIDLNTRMVTQSAQAIRENNANIMNTVISFVSNATVQGYLSETDVYEKSIALRSLSNLLFNYRYLHPTLQAVAVLEPSGDSIREGNILYSDFQAILENTRHKTFSSLVMSSAGNPLIAVRYPINSHTDFGRQIGECIFVFNVSYMLSGIQSISLEAESDFYIVDDQNITLYATHPNAIAEPLAESYASMLRESFEPTVEKKGEGSLFPSGSTISTGTLFRSHPPRCCCAISKTCICFFLQWRQWPSSFLLPPLSGFTATPLGCYWIS